MVMFIFHIFGIEVVGGVGVLAGQSYAIQVTPHGNLMTPHGYLIGPHGSITAPS